MDLKNPKWMYLKGVLFVGICGMSCGLLLADRLDIRTAVLLALAIWSAARAYYFAFYVVERYVDPSYRFAGLTDFAWYLPRKPSGREEK